MKWPWLELNTVHWPSAPYEHRQACGSIYAWCTGSVV